MIESFINICLNLILWSIIFKFILVFHEMGHAIALVLLTKEEATIKLGNLFLKNKKIRILKMNFVFYKSNPFIGCVLLNSDCKTKIAKLLFFLSGPIASLIGSVVFIVLSNILKIHLLRYIGVSFLIQFIMTIIPIKYPKFSIWNVNNKSDGYNSFLVLKDK